jgi:hypothetical protein
MNTVDLAAAFGLVVAHERLTEAEAALLTLAEVDRGRPDLYLSLVALYQHLQDQLWARHADILRAKGLATDAMLTGVNPAAPIAPAAVSAHQMLQAAHVGRPEVSARLARAWASLALDQDRLQLALALIAFCSALLETERSLSAESLDAQLRSWGASLAAA